MLVSVLIRQARKNQESDPVGWLTDLQATKWEGVNAQNGQITGTSVNGKSVYIAALPGCSIADLLMATELAIQTLENGFIAPPGVTHARMN